MKTKKLKNCGIKIISMIVPSVNGKWSKQLVLNDELYDKIKKASDENIGKNQTMFAMFMDSNCHHELLNTGYGCLTKEQFDELIKEEYNTTLGYKNGHKPMKEIA